MLAGFFWVGLGGAAGSMARYGIHMLFSRREGLPLGTLLVNLIGCFLIGCLYGYAQRHHWLAGRYMLALATGFCGGFTTFSSFALENNLLLEKGLSATAIWYSLISLIVGLALCRAGIWLTQPS